MNPIIVSGKLLFQDVTRLKLTWDEDVPSQIESKWNQWLGSLSDISLLQVPRCFKPREFDDDSVYELHHFSDASNRLMVSVIT